MMMTSPLYATLCDTGSSIDIGFWRGSWPPPDSTQGLCTMIRPDGRHVVIDDAGVLVPHHVQCDLPEGGAVVAGINHFEIVAVMRRVHEARWSGRSPSPADLEILRDWHEAHGPHYCPDGCDA